MRAWFCLTMAACAAAPRPPAIAPEKAAAFLQSVADAENQRQSISAEGTVTLSQNGVPLKGELTVAAAPQRVRFDVAADSGQTLFSLAANATTVTLLDFRNRHAQSGPAQSTVLDAAGLEDFTAPALAALLLARLPCTGERHVVAENALTVTCLGGTLRAEYSPRHDAPGYFLSAVTVPEKNLSAKFFGHTSLGFARRIELQTRAGKAVVVLTDVDANIALPDSLFQLDKPPGF